MLIFAVVQIIIGVLGWTGKLPGNSYIGIRVPEVRKNKKMWDTAHRIAGPLWTVSGVILALGAIITFNAQGWMWALSILSIIAWLIFLGMGAGMAAHTVAMMDIKEEKETGGCSSEGGCNCGGGKEEEKDPSVDCGVEGGCGSCSLNGLCENVNLDAVRAAAKDAD